MNNNRSIVEIFNETCTKFAQRPAFTCMGQTLSFKEVDELSANFAAYLRYEIGLEPGDRLAIQLPNVLQYPVVIFGAMRAGLIVVNTNPLYTEREVEHQLNDSGAKALVVLSNIAQTASKVIKNTGVKSVIVTNIADLHGFAKRCLINAVVKHVKKMVPPFSFEQSVTFRQAMVSGQKARARQGLEDYTAQADDIAVLQYTGGTTGVAKGAMLTHRNLVSNMIQVQDHLEGCFSGDNELFVAPLPLYHIYAFTVHCMCLFNEGGQSLLIPNPRDIPAFVKFLKGQKITGFVGLNTLFNALCRNEDFKKLDFSSLHTTASGGMALTHEVAALWEKTTGVKTNEGYGLTETSPVVCASRPSHIMPGTVGTPVIGTEVRTVNAEGEETATGEPGELQIRGPQVMKGYWQREEATAEVINEDGWFSTGDVAEIDKEGHIKIVDRIKDMILVSGFNVYPNEIEDVAGLHPDILEAAAIGIPDEKSGEVVKLFVVPVEGKDISKDEVIKHCRQHLTAYKVPRVVEFASDLPKSNVGKVLRKELRT